MTAIFERVLNMSLTGSIVIAVVLLARLLLRRAPKIYSYMLWAVVLFRLLCPISLSAGLSVLKPLPVTTSQGLSTVTYRPVEPVTPASGELGQEVARPESAETVKAKTGAQAMTLAAAVWLTVGGALAGCSLVQYTVLRRKLREAVPYRGEILLSDNIRTPFVMGVLSPKIYLPWDTPQEERRFIIAHERQHIHRGDPLWKLLGYLALCVHWFNPLVWLAFFLGGKDMEMSCDEAVLNRLGEDIRADYSQALLRLATHKRLIAGMPLAFGEGETKGRVRNMARWRRPKVWVSGICAVLCLAVLAVCALNPQKSDSTPVGAVVTAEERLNIRAKASASSVVVGSYEHGTAITILERKGGWGRTDRGWIALDYVTLSEDSISGTTGSASISGTTGSASMGIWGLYYTLPEGCVQVTLEASQERNEQELREGNTVIGGVRAFKIPSDISGADWLEELVFPEWGMENVGYMASGTLASGYTVEFFSDVPEGQPKTLLNRHNVYLWENRIYDVWFNEYTVSPEVESAILRTVSFGSDTAEVSSSVPIDLAMLPESVSLKSGENGAILFVKDGETIGAIDTYDIPDSVENPYADFKWLAEAGVSDADDQMIIEKELILSGGSSLYGDWEIEVESDVIPSQPQTVKRWHTFFIAERKVYDVWFDLTKISEGEYWNLMSLMVNGEPEETTLGQDAHWGESFLSNDGTVSFQADISYDPTEPAEEGTLSAPEMLAAVKREMQAGTMDGFGLGTKEMGYTDVECFVNLTDLVLETRKTDSGEEIPQLIVMGFVIYKFSDGNTIGQELGIHELMALDARDGSFLSGFGRVS